MYASTNISRGDKMKIIPLNDRVLLKSAKMEERTASGIYIPQASQEKTQIAEVIAIGTDSAINVKVGQKVLHEKYVGTEVKDGGDDYLLVKAEQILAVIE